MVKHINEKQLICSYSIVIIEQLEVISFLVDLSFSVNQISGGVYQI